MAAQASLLEFRPAASRVTTPSAPYTNATGQTTGTTSNTGDPGVDAVALPVGVSASSGQTMTIQALGNGRCFVHPLYVRLEQSGDEWLAVSTDLSLVGRGESDFDAIADLSDLIGELFDSLVEMRQTLGPLLLKQLAFLERLAGER